MDRQQKIEQRSQQPKRLETPLQVALRIQKEVNPDGAPITGILDDSVPCVLEYLRTHLDDPASLQIIHWTKPVRRSEGVGWVTTVTYIARNRFGISSRHIGVAITHYENVLEFSDVAE